MNIDYYQKWFDFQMLMLVESWFYPYYVLGKQDEWRDWSNITLNGWKSFSICK